jgi:tetratricopeptide (TPR) repeat protein
MMAGAMKFGPLPEATPVANASEAFLDAVAAYGAGRLGDAERACATVLAGDPGHFDARRLIAIVQHRLGRPGEALENSDRALAIRPDHAETLSNRGNMLRDLGRPAEALASYDRAIAIEPGFADAYYNRAIALAELKRFEAAVASYDNVLSLAPDHAVALNNRGNVLMRLARFAEALASLDRALALRPDYAEAYNNRAVALQELKHFDAALESYDKAIEIKPAYAEAFNNRGVALKELRRFDEALASHNKAQEIAPDFADAHWNEALLRLLTGDLADGWAKYEWRWKRASFTSPRRDFSQPPWDGFDSLYDRTILLHAEQGLGDAIQFARYVPMVAARGAQVILEVAEPLRRLMGSLSGGARIVAKGEALPPFDVHCPLMSLPRAFGTTVDQIPAATPYLHPAAEAQSAWEARLCTGRHPRIGIAWAGNPNHDNDHNRSIPLGVLEPLMGIEATYVSLQKELRSGDEALLQEHEEVFDVGSTLGDFADTAALVSCLDLVISVDTSLVHLAGALAKPVFVLLPYTPDWRWLLGRDTTPWYPSARLFRQTAPGNWDEVVARVAAELPIVGIEDAPDRPLREPQ